MIVCEGSYRRSDAGLVGRLQPAALGQLKNTRAFHGGSGLATDNSPVILKLLLYIDCYKVGADAKV